MIAGPWRGGLSQEDLEAWQRGMREQEVLDDAHAERTTDDVIDEPTPTPGEP